MIYDAESGFPLPGCTCFYCSRAIVHHPYIDWMGDGSTIFLHPGCAVDLAIRVLKDVHEIECKFHGEVHIIDTGSHNRRD